MPKRMTEPFTADERRTIRAVRALRGITIKSLAERANLDPERTGQLLRGSRWPRPAERAAILAVLGL
jgi:transcriptional regulator with XRE-family HTH domain